MKFVRTFLGVALVGGCASASAAVFSPRVLSPHHADTYSLKTFAEFCRWRGLEGDAKIYEVFKYLADSRTGVYPLGVPAWEGRERLSEYGAVRDPVKMLNVYPIGHCGTLGPAMAGIMEDMGVGPARTLVLPGWSHVAAEVFSGGGWHYLDLDLRAVFLRGDGSLASMAAARADASLWQRPNEALFFPLDSLPTVRQAYQQSAVEHCYGWNSGGHTMDFVLRQGETLTRWWQPQGGRWNHHTSYNARPFPRRLFEQEPRGPKCKHPSFTVHTHGNGRFVYRPDLTDRSSDFEDGVYAAQNVRPAAAGLTLAQAGSGYAVFEVRTPYVIVPLVGDLETAADDREAAIVKLEARDATLALSLDQGLSWNDLGAAPRTLDLTPWVSGTYGYLLRVNLAGEPDQAVVRALELTTWVQVHPASLPALRRGANTMRLVAGDHYGLPTRVLEVRTQAGEPAEFLKYLAEPPRDYDPARATSRVRGVCVAKVQPPPGTRVAWFSAGAAFAAHRGEAAGNTRNSIAYARDETGDFQVIYRAEVPRDHSHWHYNVDREVRLDPPARAVWVRYVGDPALNNFRIYAHCLEDHPRTSRPVTVTHTWKEQNQPKTARVRLEAPGEYQVVAAAEPADESIELAVTGAPR